MRVLSSNIVGSRRELSDIVDKWVSEDRFDGDSHRILSDIEQVVGQVGDGGQK